MNNGSAIALTLLVLASAIFFGWYAETRLPYFPSQQTGSTACYDKPDLLPHPADPDAEYFASRLRAFAEPSLYPSSSNPAPEQVTSLRFTWLRSLSSQVVVRLTTLNTGATRMTAKLMPKGVGLIGAPRHLERTLTSDEVRELAMLIQSTDVFQLTPSICDVKADGARWILETSSPLGGYDHVHRHSPMEGSVREVGVFMLGLIGWDDLVVD